MPRAEAAMERGTILQWFRREGEYVKQGDLLVEVEGEKASFEVEAPHEGTLRKILHKEGAEVEAGGTLALIGSADESLPEEFSSSNTSSVVATHDERQMPEKPRINISPAARKMAERMGVDYHKIRPTGPQGRIIREDVLEAYNAQGNVITQSQITEAKQSLTLEGPRRLTVERLSKSFRESIPVALSTDVLMAKLQMLRENVQQEKNIQIPIDAVVLAAAGRSLERHQILNSTFDGDRIMIHAEVNVGVAIEAQQGLLVPVVNDANKKRLLEIAKELSSFVDLASSGKLPASALGNSTFTITNLGHLGVDSFIPIINPPNSAILGVGRISRQAVIDQVDRVEIAEKATLTLVFDHRVTDGAPAARFLSTIKEILESPEQLPM